MPSQSPSTGSPLGMGGGSNALFNAMRNMRALEQQASPLSMQQVLRFFSPEETSIASFRPESTPEAAGPTAPTTPTTDRTADRHTRDTGRGPDQGDPGGHGGTGGPGEGSGANQSGPR